MRASRRSRGAARAGAREHAHAARPCPRRREREARSLEGVHAEPGADLYGGAGQSDDLALLLQPEDDSVRSPLAVDVIRREPPPDRALAGLVGFAVAGA